MIPVGAGIAGQTVVPRLYDEIRALAVWRRELARATGDAVIG